MTVNAVFPNFCKWSSTTAGTGSFTVGAAYTSDYGGSHNTPANSNVIDGNSYVYYAQSADGTQTETGRGVYTASSHTLSRPEVIGNSNGTTSPINFLTDPIVDMFPTPIALETAPPFPSGTLMLFQQTSAPTGWTKQGSFNDAALRVVSGTASSGGSNAFSTVFAQTVVGSHTLAIGEIPSHTHTETGLLSPCGGSNGLVAATSYQPSLGVAVTSSAAGGGGSHNHTITMAIEYVDVIIAQKN